MSSDTAPSYIGAFRLLAAAVGLVAGIVGIANDSLVVALNTVGAIGA